MRHRAYAHNALATAKLLLILLKTMFLPKKNANLRNVSSQFIGFSYADVSV